MTNLTSLWGQETQLFHLLSPDNVMDAVEGLGKRLTGRIMALNSLENRVYEVELAAKLDVAPGFSPSHVIIKFYRPGRWEEKQIQEEIRAMIPYQDLEIKVLH